MIYGIWFCIYTYISLYSYIDTDTQNSIFVKNVCQIPLKNVRNVDFFN